MSGGIFSLNTALAPRLIKILYILALIIIASGVALRITQGVMRIARPAIHHALAAPVNSGQTHLRSAQNPSGAGLSSPYPPSFRNGGHYIRWRRHHRGIALLRFFPANNRATVIGMFWIVRALIVGGMAIILVRILAEVANAILLTRNSPPRK